MERKSETIFETDEYGRLTIVDDEIMVFIAAAEGPPYRNDDPKGCNSGCGSNTGCYNSGCR